jgi:Holliday junction resolvase YEN1
MKRGNKVGGRFGRGDMESMQFKLLLDEMGLEYWDVSLPLSVAFVMLKYSDTQAPGEAEAELAQINKAGLIDAVLTDDVDALVFGATCVLRKYVERCFRLL